MPLAVKQLSNSSVRTDEPSYVHLDGGEGSLPRQSLLHACVKRWLLRQTSSVQDLKSTLSYGYATSLSSQDR